MMFSDDSADAVLADVTQKDTRWHNLQFKSIWSFPLKTERC